MENLSGPLLQVVLEVKEGNGFAFMTTPLVVVAALNGNKIESTEIKPAVFTQFSTELLWQVDKKYLRRLRTSNTALKIECFSVSNSNRRERVGYILLNLKEAQIVPRQSGKIANENWHRLIGVKSDVKFHNPELLLVFKIEECADATKNARMICSQSTDCIPLTQSQTSMDSLFQNTDLSASPIQIGPDICSDRYELAISINEVVLPADLSDTEGMQFQYSIMGVTRSTDKFSGVQTDIGYAATLQVKSQPQYFKEYFKDNPTVPFNLICGVKTVGIATMDLHEMMHFPGNGPVSVSTNVPIRTVVELPNGDITPSVVVTVSVTPKPEKITIPPRKIKSDHVHMDSGDASMVMERDLRPVPPASSTDTKSTSSEFPPYFETHKLNPPETPSLTQSSTTSLRSDDDVESRNLKQAITFGADPSMKVDTCLSPQNGCRPVSSSDGVVPGQFVRDVTLKVCEELEDWKEKQQELFKFELKRKTERHLKKLTSEWVKRKNQLEAALLERIESSQALFSKVQETLHALSTKIQAVSEKEKELKRVKEEINARYTAKFQQLREASKVHELEMQERMNKVIMENRDLNFKLGLKEKEIQQLKGFVAHQMDPSTQADAESLKKEVTDLRTQLEKAVESKIFFKEQWGKTVRELHKLKEYEEEQFSVHLKKNRNELHSQKLVNELTQEVGEMRRDQNAIQAIKNEISKFKL